MNKRVFVTGSLVLLALPHLAIAQQGRKLHRIGYLGSTSPAGPHAQLVEAFRRGLRDLGYVEGGNLVIEYRWAEGKYDRLPDLAAELVRLPVDVIVTHGTPGSWAAKQVRAPDEFGGVFSAMVKRQVDGAVVIDDPMLIARAPQLVEVATRSRIPTIGDRAHVDAGGLMAYGVDLPAFWRHAAVFVDKILKGARPGELPIEQSTKFELVINRKTARALGLAIPPALLLRADQRIE